MTPRGRVPILSPTSPTPGQEFADLSVEVAEDDGDREALKAVQQRVDVLVDGEPDALTGVTLGSIDGEEEVESEEGDEDQSGPDRFPADPSSFCGLIIRPLIILTGIAGAHSRGSTRYCPAVS